ncbi:MAG: hypothetical protein Q7S12_02760 [bacterium]|nr:hypothetical protein [bacterium]
MNMKNGGKAIATVAVWGGVVVLSYMFHSFGILNGGGAFWLVVMGLFCTAWIWS